MEGQITKILSNLYFVTSGNVVYECHSRGKFRNENITPLVGDYVIFDPKEKYILEIKERINSLSRPMVSNITQAFIITSAKDPDFSSNLLDKLLVICHYNKIKPIICWTKLDLLNRKEFKEIKMYIKYYKKIGYTVLTNKQVFKIKKSFKDNTTVFTGQTGSGKSTLLNKIDKNLKLKTGEISKALGRGKHTTRHVELLHLFGGKVLDTPGFSSIDISVIPKEDIKEAFIEFSNIKCPYKDCYHISEKECLVKEALKKEVIAEFRYENYKKFISTGR